MTEIVQQPVRLDSGQTAGEEPEDSSKGWGAISLGMKVVADEAWDEAAHSLRIEVADPLGQKISEVDAKGQAALDRLTELASEASNPEDFWDATVEYRALVEQTVVSPLVKYLRDKRPGENVSVIAARLFESLFEASKTIPAEIITDLSGTALDRRRGDGPLRRVRKASSRLVFSLGKPRPVKVGELATYHLTVRLPRFYSRKRQEAQFGLALCLTRLERAVSKWSHSVLDLEAGMDAAAGLKEQPDDIQEGNVGRVESGADTSFNGEKIVAQVKVAADELSEGLVAAVEALDTVRVSLSPEQVSDVNEFLDYDVKALGTFLLRRADRSIPDAEYLPAKMALEHDAVWIKYQEESLNRIRLNQHLLRTRAAVVGLAGAIVDKVYSATLVPLKDIYARLESSIVREKHDLENLFAGADQVEHAKLANRLNELSDETIERIERVTSELGGINAADEVLRGLGTREWERARKAVEQLPAKLDIHAIDPGSDIPPSIYARTSSVDLKKIANGVLGLRFADQLRKPAEHLRKDIARRWREVNELGDVIAFGTNAAFDSLNNDKGEFSIDDAREFSLNGLDRALERTEAVSLEGPWNEFNDEVVRVLMKVWGHFHQHARTEELDTDQWAGIGSRLSVVMSTYRLSLYRGWSVISAKLEVVWRLFRQKLRALIRKGQSAVGVSGTASSDGSEAINELRNIERARASLPLIYRRLFIFESLNDASFLENRAKDIDYVRAHFERWTKGIQVKTLIISAQLGSGRSSFINTLRNTALIDADVRSVHFGTRHRTQSGVCAEIAKALEIDIPGPIDFRLLAQALEELPPRTKPLVCELYDLEHLAFSVPEGLMLARELMIFFSHTDDLIYWVGGVNQLSHQFISSTSTTTGLVQFHTLSPFDRESLEAVIMNRHRRSGLEIVFREPHSPSTLMRQRLKRAQSERDKQNIIRNAFFDRLSRLSGQNIRLALFYWIRCLQFDPESDSVSVDWPVQLDFSFLSDLDLQSAFSLRSFLMHQTLTMEEHNEIFRMSIDQGIIILESLLNLGILTSLDNLDGFDRRIVPGVRYRVHPLLLGPVLLHLEGRHIVY